MIVELLTEVARGHGVLSRGIHDLKDEIAAEFLQLGWAVPVEIEPQPTVETAAEYTHKPRGRKDARNQATRRSG